MGGFSLIHWLILGVVILLLFGGNRFSHMMGDVAKGLKAFKQGMSDEDAPPPSKQAEPRQLPRDRPIDLTANPPAPGEQPSSGTPDETRR